MDRLIFIAEIGLNHNGDLKLAKEMVESAKDNGADIVKFQTIKAEKLVSPNTFSTKIDGFGFKDVKNLGDFWKKVSINIDFHFTIKELCDKLKIEFMSTPFDMDSLDLLNKLNVKRYKISSGDITHFPLIKEIALQNKPIILSTGASTVDEIDNVVGYIFKNGNKDLTLLHCVSLYPTKPNLAHLNVIPFLKQRYNLPIGYSDHTQGYHIPLAAIALGATTIEKHFTIDKDLPGPDQKLSADPDEFKKMVMQGKDIFIALGKEDKELSEEEVEMRVHLRRSIVAINNLKKETVLNAEIIDFKRPGNGISPIYTKDILGRKLIKNCNKDESIQWEYLND